jgi:hypothetical protein
VPRTARRDWSVGKVPAGDRATQHHRSADNLATRKDALELTIEPCRTQRIDEPGLRGTRKKVNPRPRRAETIAHQTNGERSCHNKT